MSTPFHTGELAVQARAGVTEMAARVGRGIGRTMPDAAQDFLRAQPWVIVASEDAEGRPWASVLHGTPGFAHATDAQTVLIDTSPLPGDPLGLNLTRGDRLGLLAIESATRRRMRVNGSFARQPDGTLLVHTQQVYALCPKYIQARAWEARLEQAPYAAETQWGTELSPAQQHWIAQADTFFIATAHPDAGLDASHRGGPSGFVRVTSPRRLVFPDYSGNTMFNTLGNLAVNPRAWLLFVDFEQGHTLQLTGQAWVDWDQKHAASVPGAERLVIFDLEEAVELAGVLPLRWRFLSSSPFNPVQ